MVVLVALALRLAALAATSGLPLASDASDYSRHARSIAAGSGFPPSVVDPHGGASAIRPPAFPFLLAGVYALTDDSVAAGRIAQALLGALIVGLIGLIALELWGAEVALVAAALAAIFPPLVIDGVALLSEPLFVVFELAAVMSILRWRRRRRLAWLIGAGTLIGGAWLTRVEGALLLIPLMVAARGTGPWRAARTYRAPATLLLSALLVVTPWTVRNAIELHAFVPVSDQDGYTLAGTYNATSRAHDAEWLVATEDPAMAMLYAHNHRLNEAALDARFRSAAERFIASDPGYLPVVAVHNTLRLFNLGGAAFEREAARGDYGLSAGWATTMTLGLLPFLVLAALGLFTRSMRLAPRWFWAIPGLMLAPVMILATNRTRAPIDPFLLMLGALAITSLTAAVRRRSKARVRGRSSGRDGM